MYIGRACHIKDKLKDGSLFLFGPRSTGKTSYIREELSDDIVLRWDLLDTRLRRAAEKDPGLLYDEIAALDRKSGLVVIDEIQKVPELLDEVHRAMEETGLRFLLTGSSARKLVKSGVNLLGGRAGRVSLFPFVYPEIKGYGYTLEHIFTSGLLPSAFLAKTPGSILSAYIETYLYDEIQSEGAVRNLPAFSSFLEVVALSNGNIINYSNIASDVGLSKTSIREWYQILSDTLLGFELQAYKATRRRKPIETAKYYLFDVGVLRKLLRINTPVETQSEYGMFFETLIINEIKAYLSYKGRDESLCYWRSTSGYEVDIVIGNDIAIETKSSKALVPRDFRGLKAIREENIIKKYIIVCRENRKRLVDSTYLVYPYEEFLSDLWNDRIIG